MQFFALSGSAGPCRQTAPFLERNGRVAYDTRPDGCIARAQGNYTYYRRMPRRGGRAIAQLIEALLGRKHRVRYGPREVDLDLIIHGDLSIKTETLTVPHPRATEREFVSPPSLHRHRDLPHAKVMRPLADVVQRLGGKAESAVVGKLLAHFDGEATTQSCVELVAGLPELGRRGERTAVMGILNATPDSFSDGGRADLLAHADRMVEEGADIVDIGGESTRPGAKAVDVDDELSRVIPLVEEVCRRHPRLLVSVDTRRAVVARYAVAAGARIVNDVSGGMFDPDMLGHVADLPVAYIAMHMRGDPQTMQQLTDYGDVVSDVAYELGDAVTRAQTAGVAPWRLILDPGIGFAKTFSQNLALMRNLSEFKRLLQDYPLLLGPSRKAFLGVLTKQAQPDR